LPPRRIALVCVTPRPDADALVELQMPSYGIRRIQAAVIGDPNNPGHVVALIDFGRDDIAAYVERILDFEPDLIGFSIYVWSMSCLIAVAREIKRQRPGCAIVFGGPSARKALFELEPYQRPGEFLDAIVEGDGEFVFREIAALGDLSYESIRLVPGVTAPSNSGWLAAAARPAGFDLDLIPSPYHLGVMEPRQVAYLETYRGCPMSCRFCEWGASSKSRSMFSVQYIANEIGQFERHGSSAVFLLDAGLNLNLRAFHNLREANRRTGYLRKTLFWAEIYPSVIRDEHLRFLEEIGPAYLGVGMQSMDPMVLELQQRPSDSKRFEQAVRNLAQLTTIELQIIAGLPGDSPDGFRRTLDYALSLPASVRAYHCLVLPDALMTRGLPDWNMAFDPGDLSMISCMGWSLDALAAMRDELDQKARRLGGQKGRFWWSFPRQLPRAAAAPFH
jgi:radical SAM superfamily enzyme YgiQ (UPF0313 family)